MKQQHYRGKVRLIALHGWWCDEVRTVRLCGAWQGGASVVRSLRPLRLRGAVNPIVLTFYMRSVVLHEQRGFKREQVGARAAGRLSLARNALHSTTHTRRTPSASGDDGEDPGELECCKQLSRDLAVDPGTFGNGRVATGHARARNGTRAHAARRARRYRYDTTPKTWCICTNNLSPSC